jgi:hypothetical protein
MTAFLGRIQIPNPSHATAMENAVSTAGSWMADALSKWPQLHRQKVPDGSATSHRVQPEPLGDVDRQR